MMSSTTSCCSYSSHGDTPFCACGEKAKLNTSWTIKNPTRQFWGCSNYRAKCSKDCSFFQWLDPEIKDQHKTILKALLNDAKSIGISRRKGDKECIQLLNQIVNRDNMIQRLQHVQLLYLVLGFIMAYSACKMGFL